MQYLIKGGRFLSIMAFNSRVNKINNLLVLLILVIVVGLSLYQLNSYFFTKQTQKIHAVIRNNDIGQQINTYLIEDFRSIERIFLEQLSTLNQKTHEYNFSQIDAIINRSNVLLDVLENGGEFTRVVRIMTEQGDVSSDKGSYKVDNKSIYNIEILVIRTFLVTIKERVLYFNKLLQLRSTGIAKVPSDLKNISEDINLFFINLNPRFVRIEEHLNKLYIETRIENDKIRTVVSRQKNQFILIKIIISLFIFISTLILVVIIVKRIIILNREVEISEEKFRTFADFTNDWEYWNRSDGSYIYVSPSVQKITGYSPEEFYKDSDILAKIIYPEDSKAYFNHISNRFNSSDEEEPSNFRLTTKEGREIWINHRCRLVYGKNGNLLGVRGSNRDITKEMNLLNQVTKANEELTKSNEEKILLIKESHHRIKNDLSIAASLLHMQADSMSNEEDYILMENSSHRLLAMAYLHSMLYKNEFSDVNMKLYFDKIISRLIECFDIEDRRKNIKLNIGDLSLPGKIATSCGLILNELFTNAYKYRLSKDPEAILEIDFHLKGDNTILMRVYNDGVIADVKEADSKEPSFGLTMITILVDGLDGSLELKQDRGAEFIITFPLDGNNK